MRSYAWLFLLPSWGLLASCQTAQERSSAVASETSTGVSIAVAETENGLGDALLTPLTDLNMRRKPIPDILRSYQSPYDPIVDSSCDGITREIVKLAGVLGPDVDFVTDEASRGEQAGAAASDATLSAVSGTTGGFLPFSGLIRSASGAESYQRRYNRAFKTGYERRAYLKGIGYAAGCMPPAAPLFQAPDVGG